MLLKDENGMSLVRPQHMHIFEKGNSRAFLKGSLQSTMIQVSQNFKLRQKHNQKLLHKK